MRRPLMAVCMCLVAVVAIWLIMGNPGGENASPPEVNEWDGSTVTVTGHVYRKDTKYFYLDSVLLQNSAASQQQIFSLNENLICEYDEDAPTIGSMVEVRGIFQCFQNATNPGEFDSAAYYHSIGICGKLQEVTLIDRGKDCSVLQETLFNLQQYFRKRLYQVFPGKEASVMAAMLLGDKSDLDSEIKDLYQDNGIIHILSISGLHISIIGMSIYKALRRMGVPVWVAAPVGGIVLLLYGIMTGMSVSACRAIGMFLIRILGEIAGRTYDMLTAMAIMAAGMVGVNPSNLENAGFLLSFGSILGIGALYPALLPKDTPKLCQSVLASLSITLTTLPIQLWFYYEVPTYSILLNLLVLPFMTPVMLTGMIAMLIPGLGIVGTVASVILSGYEWFCMIFEKLPFARWNPGRPEIWQVVLYYCLWVLVLGLGYYRAHGAESKKPKEDKKLKENNRKCCRKLLFAQYGVAAAAVIVLAFPYPKQTTVTFLDVGQGDCICIQLASGEVYLFDCGSSSRSKIGEYVLMPFLKYHGISHVDGVFVSHPDADHCNGIKELLANGTEWGITVEAVILPDVADDLQIAELVEAAESAAQKTPITVGTIKAGDSWKIGDCQFLCLHPSENTDITDTNAYSQCFYIEQRGAFSLLLTGDVEEEGEEQLFRELQKRNIEDIAILKVAHHGSGYSTGEELLEQISPAVAVISCGEGNRYGHPHEETLRRLDDVGCKVLMTPEYGAITIYASDNGSYAEVYRGKKAVQP